MVNRQTNKFISIARKSKGLKTRKILDLEEEFGMTIEEMISAPISCRKKKYNGVCGVCVTCLYDIPEQTAVVWRKKFKIKGMVGRPVVVLKEGKKI